MAHGAKVKHFSDLMAWQKAHELVLGVYRVTLDFPTEERYGLVSQMRRSVISITSNIAEGFGRKTVKDKRHFITLSITSLAELENQLLICRDLKYIDSDIHTDLQNQIAAVGRLLGGLRRSAASKPKIQNT